MLSTDEIADLAQRCKAAVAHKWKIGLAEHFAKELGYAEGDSLPSRVRKFSAAHLLHLIEKLSEKPAFPPTEAPTPSIAKFKKVGKAAKKVVRDEDLPVTKDDLPMIKES